MVDIHNIGSFTRSYPKGWTIFGLQWEFDALPPHHREQILVLDEQAADFIFRFTEQAHLTTGGFWNPFEKGNFKHVDQFADFFGDADSIQKLKKWLYNRGIPFSNWVFVLANNPYPIYTTWKMVLKYADTIFGYDDIIVFDRTINWCLTYYHEDIMFFGRDNVYDNTGDYLTMEALNERKKQYPGFKHPYL